MHILHLTIIVQYLKSGLTSHGAQAEAEQYPEITADIPGVNERGMFLETEAEDETIVYVALQLLLETVTYLGHPMNVEWTMSYVWLHVCFAAANYNTVADGALRRVIDKGFLACIEVKLKRKRKKGLEKILVQETV
ncbi:hypothetical protein N7478_004631 [Penicillium angulare]|uniref:uncharacterized protein n=1 Tax=Penicillium angulare TaxID=116970 RepID=UPI0025401395|nr:uncharacterized protein N7478_004631 [Penicillium angulare]KAJ5279259.1 hypothetical protein N7478_004631 [Penicillium angulare]